MTFRTFALIAGALVLAVILKGRLENEGSVREVAVRTACGRSVCEAVLKKTKRTLFGWEFEYATYGAFAHVVGVHCVRELWVVGEYDCHVATANGMLDQRFR